MGRTVVMHSKGVYKEDTQDSLMRYVAYERMQREYEALKLSGRLNLDCKTHIPVIKNRHELFPHPIGINHHNPDPLSSKYSHPMIVLSYHSEIAELRYNVAQTTRQSTNESREISVATSSWTIASQRSEG